MKLKLVVVLKNTVDGSEHLCVILKKIIIESDYVVVGTFLSRPGSELNV
jgi:hypothetical protein